MDNSNSPGVLEINLRIRARFSKVDIIAIGFSIASLYFLYLNFAPHPMQLLESHEFESIAKVFWFVQYLLSFYSKTRNKKLR